MPTENERKFILRINCEQDVAAIAYNKSEIHQAYLVSTKGVTFRVRSMTTKKGKIQYFFTFKCNTGDRVLEIEKKINRRDFVDLWQHSLSKLEKTRYKLNGEYKGWVVDFFHDHHDNTYFVMAECEMPEGQISPTSIPPVVQKALIYEVPLNDTRFCSKLIGDVRYATRLLQEIYDK